MKKLVCCIPFMLCFTPPSPLFPCALKASVECLKFGDDEKLALMRAVSCYMEGDFSSMYLFQVGCGKGEVFKSIAEFSWWGDVKILENGKEYSLVTAQTSFAQETIVIECVVMGYSNKSKPKPIELGSLCFSTEKESKSAEVKISDLSLLSVSDIRTLAHEIKEFVKQAVAEESKTDSSLTRQTSGKNILKSLSE